MDPRQLLENKLIKCLKYRQFIQITLKYIAVFLFVVTGSTRAISVRCQLPLLFCFVFSPVTFQALSQNCQKRLLDS